MATKTDTKKAGFSIFETGGKQYEVSTGDVITIEKLSGVEKEGEKITFDKVLLVDDGKETKIGAPYIDGALVEAELVENGRAKKVTGVKFKNKTRSHKRFGHRQPYAKVKIK